MSVDLRLMISKKYWFLSEFNLKLKEQHILKDLQQTWGTFKKLELDREYPAGSITVGTERKIGYLHPLDHQKMQFPMPEKHSIIYQSTTFAYVYYPYVNLLNFASFLHKSQQFFFQKKIKILVKNRKIRCLLTVTKYLLCIYFNKYAPITLSWLWNCRTSSKKKEFHYQNVFHLKS